ncbi:ComF family protein [Desulforamulus profundi]|uniref:ComF family protein n=1 Tax=Desulforamulus profundi TaxID=1383067 RepID=UPI001EE562C4|nr:ComF family protein [Desulforamulus profundi]
MKTHAPPVGSPGKLDFPRVARLQAVRPPRQRRPVPRLPSRTAGLGGQTKVPGLRQAGPPQGRVTLCGDCQSQPPPFEMARAVGPYEGGLRQAIHLFKYKRRKSLAPLLGGLMLETLQKHPRLLHCDLVLPVPMSRGRLRERGFNQAALLARQVARGLNLPLSDRVLIKGETPPQTGLTRPQREQNLRGSFKVKAPEEIRGKNLLIVDDVFTTGSTVSAMAETLKEQGAAGIFVITLANAAK